MERSLIPIVGIHGSGKSRLGEQTAKKLSSEYSIEHISMGRVIRRIAGGAISSYFADVIKKHMLNQPHELIEDAIIHGILSETLDAYHDTQHLLIDGVPRTKAQAEDVDILAFQDDRRIAGILMTIISDEIAINRMLKRGPRGEYESDLSKYTAREKIETDKEYFKDMHLRSYFSEVPFVEIDTSGEKTDTVAQGVRTIQTLIIGD